MSGWASGPWLGFDTESTGVDPLSARIVTACVAFRSESDSGWTRSWLADAGGEEIPEQAAAIHGITTEKARIEGRPVAEVAVDVRDLLYDGWAKGVPIVAYNASYDLSLLNAELIRAGLGGLDIRGPVLDPLVIDRAMDPRRRGSRKLSDVCAHYNVRHTSASPGEAANDGAHEAAADVLATLRIVWRLAQKYPDLAALDVATLHAQQSVWHEQWCESITAYWRSIGKGDTPDAAWPIRREVVAA